jgi:cytidylate kinase
VNPRVVAIDGAAGSGKSTLARALARSLGLPYVNTGLMYRGLTAAALRSGVEQEDERGLVSLLETVRFSLSGQNPPELVVEGYPEDALTSPAVEAAVSAVARHPGVRERMRVLQRSLGKDGAVMEGRDIATVVFPDASVKLFLVADEAERTARRARERAATDAADVAEALRLRDVRDARTTPLEAAPGAIVIDTGAIDVDTALAAALRIVDAAWSEGDA